MRNKSSNYLTMDINKKCGCFLPKYENTQPQKFEHFIPT